MGVSIERYLGIEEHMTSDDQRNFQGGHLDTTHLGADICNETYQDGRIACSKARIKIQTIFEYGSGKDEAE